MSGCLFASLVQELLKNDSIRSGDLSLRGGEEGETWKKGADEAREERVGHFLTFLLFQKYNLT